MISIYQFNRDLSVRAIIVVLAMITLYVWPTAGSAQQVAIESATTGKCMDLPDGNTTNGWRLRMFDCVATSANQVFEFGAGNTLRIFGKCVDAQSGLLRQGDAVAIWDCNNGANQQWTLGADGLVRLGSTNLCLDVADDNRGNGALLMVYGCHGGPNQKFRSRPRQVAAASSSNPSRTPQEMLDLARLRAGIDAALTGAASLNNTSAFTMPMGNNLNNTSAFTMPMGNNLNNTSAFNRTTQALAQDVVGVLHAMGATNAAQLQCLGIINSAAVLLRPGECARYPENSIWIFGRDNKIRQFDRWTERPSDRCLTVVAQPGGARPAAVTSCSRAVSWMNHPTLLDALSPQGEPGWVLGSSPERSAGALLIAYPAQINFHIRWALLPVPKTTR